MTAHEFIAQARDRGAQLRLLRAHAAHRLLLSAGLAQQIEALAAFGVDADRPTIRALTEARELLAGAEEDLEKLGAYVAGVTGPEEVDEVLARR